MLDRLLYSFIRVFKINIPFQITIILEIKILKRNKFKLFIVKGRENLLKLVFIILIIIGFFLIAAS